MNRNFRSIISNYAGLFAVLGSLAIASPRQASAQIVSVPGSLVVTIDTPAGGSTLAGTVTVHASISPVGALVNNVQFRLDGVNLGAADSSAPYSVAWSTTTSMDGSHTLTAVARDLLGIEFVSNPVTVMVSNAPPPDTTPPTVAITAPASGSTVSGTVTVAAAASDNVGVASVQFMIDGAAPGTTDTSAPYSATWDTTTSTNGAHTLTAVARDAAGNTGSSAPVTVTVSNGPAADTTPPTVTITAPASGSTTTGMITVSANASDNVGVAGVQFMLDGAALGAQDTTSPYGVSWDTTTATNGSHTLTAVARDAAGNSGTSAPVTVTVSNGSGGATFAPGDLLVSIVDGPVQWRRADGTLVKALSGTIPGPSEGLRFDKNGDLFVPHWCADGQCATGNTVEHFDTHGVSQGAFGSGYNCNPHDLAFDASNRAYVGLADCSGDIIQFTSGQLSATYPVTPENRGAFFIDLAADGCTLFYTSQGTQVKRFDACQNRQLADFNAAALPSGAAEGIRVLPDGGVLVASGSVITRLNASGVLTQSYSVTGEAQIWAGLDLVGDGTFWGVNYATSNVYKFDLPSGSVLATFNTATAANTAIAIAVKR